MTDPRPNRNFSKIGKSAREPDIPHRNFIPKDIEPLDPQPEPLTPQEQLRLLQTLAAPRAAKTPPASPAAQAAPVPLPN